MWFYHFWKRHHSMILNQREYIYVKENFVDFGECQNPRRSTSYWHHPPFPFSPSDRQRTGTMVQDKVVNMKAHYEHPIKSSPDYTGVSAGKSICSRQAWLHPLSHFSPRRNTGSLLRHHHRPCNALPNYLRTVQMTFNLVVRNFTLLRGNGRYQYHGPAWSSGWW